MIGLVRVHAHIPDGTAVVDVTPLRFTGVPARMGSYLLSPCAYEGGRSMLAGAVPHATVLA